MIKWHRARRDPARSSVICTLLTRGNARVHPIGIGLDVDENYALIDFSSRHSKRVLAIGPLARATFWECTAIPDIRLQCRRLTQISTQRWNSTDWQQEFEHWSIECKSQFERLTCIDSFPSLAKARVIAIPFGVPARRLNTHPSARFQLSGNEGRYESNLTQVSRPTQWKAGVSGDPNGRPVGSSVKHSQLASSRIWLRSGLRTQRRDAAHRGDSAERRL